MDLKVEPRTVQLQTVTRLRDGILSGYFQPGQRLIEADLCQMMHVSRTTVREALRRLEAERLVTIVPNRGPSVAEITWQEAREIYDVRALLEGEVAALLAERAKPAQLRQMEQALQAFVTADANDDSIGRLTSTSRFYDVMLVGCRNSIIAEMLQGLVARINFLRARSMSQPGRAKHSAAEMRVILEAIENKDPVGARAAAVNHVRNACASAEIVFDPPDQKTRNHMGQPS